jgi:hypothetical protein
VLAQAGLKPMLVDLCGGWDDQRRTMATFRHQVKTKTEGTFCALAFARY